MEPHCACTELFRVDIGPFSVPIGTTTLLLVVMSALLLPGLVRGWWNRRRAARAMQDVSRS